MLLQRRPLSQVLLALVVLVLGSAYFYLWTPDAGVRLNQLGLFCSIFTISMYLSPLADLVSGLLIVGGAGTPRRNTLTAMGGWYS